MLDEIVDRCPNGEDNIQDAGYPDELLCECARGEKIGPGDNKSNNEHKDEEDKCVGVEGESVAGVIDATAGEGLVVTVPGDGEA